MTLVELATLIGSDVHLGASVGWSCHLRSVEIKDGPMLSSEWGIGNTAREAIVDYVSKIRGKPIVINAMSKEHRKEFTVPQTLEAGDLH